MSFANVLASLYVPASSIPGFARTAPPFEGVQELRALIPNSLFILFNMPGFFLVCLVPFFSTLGAMRQGWGFLLFNARSVWLSPEIFQGEIVLIFL